MSGPAPVPPPAERAEIAARVRRRMAPTIGAVVLSGLLSVALVGLGVHQHRADRGIAAAARMESCERGNDLRASVRTGNRIVAGLVDAVAAPAPPQLAAARAALLAHLRAHPRDPVARHAELATRPDHLAAAAVRAARAELARQDRLLAPVDCASSTRGAP